MYDSSAQGAPFLLTEFPNCRAQIPGFLSTSLSELNWSQLYNTYNYWGANFSPKFLICPPHFLKDKILQLQLFTDEQKPWENSN